MSGQSVEELDLLVEELATLPAVAAEIITRSADPNVDLGRLANVIEKDAALTLRYMTLANSAALARGHRVRDLRMALVKIGLRQVRCMALCIAVHEVYPSDGRGAHPRFHPVAFWKHTLAVAACARILAARWGTAAPEDAFLAGILHDVGKTAFEQKAQVAFLGALDAAQEQQISLARAEREVFGFDHAELGARLLRHWKLPELLVDVVRHQLDPDPPSDLSAEAMELIGVLRAARSVCRAIHVGDDGEGLPRPTLNQVLKGLRMSQAELEEIAAQVRDEVERAAAVLGLEVDEPRRYLEAMAIADRELARLGLPRGPLEQVPSPEGRVFEP